MVLLIISIFALFSLPRLTSFFTSEKLSNDAARLADYLEHLRDEAIFKKRHLLLVCKIEEGHFRVIPAESDGKESPAEVMLRPFTMGEAVRIVDIEKRGSGKRTEGEAEINFYPGGNTEAALIHLRDGDEKALTLEIAPLSRKIAIVDGYVETI